MQPREVISHIERLSSLPQGDCDRFAGYAVMGLTFRSGDVLALRRFPVSSVGPGFTTVWHRGSTGHWTFYSSIDPSQGCSRYFGRDIQTNVVSPIHIEWKGAARLRVVVERKRALDWEINLTETVTTKAMNFASSLIPKTWRQKPAMLRAMSNAARLMLKTGPVNFAGRTPNGQQFVANLNHIWMVDWSVARVRGEYIGAIGPLPEQARLGDFLIPQRGILAVTKAFLDCPDSDSDQILKIAA